MESPPRVDSDSIPSKFISTEPTHSAPSRLPQPNETVGADTPRWAELVKKLNLKGLVKQLAQQSELLVLDDERIELRCENRMLASNAAAVSGMEKALAAYFGKAHKIFKVHVGTVDTTPAKIQAQVKQVELAGAQQIIGQDPTVQALVREFDGMILPNSIRSV